MAKWLDNTDMSNVWGDFKTKLASSLSSLSDAISQNTSDISDRVTKKQFGLLNAYRYKSNQIFTNTSSDIYKYLYSYYASGYSSATSNNYKKTITKDGRIFEYDCSNKWVIEINAKTGAITKYNMTVQNTSITYYWYIGTYVSGSDIYSYLWGTGGSGWGIFKVKHGNATYANSVQSVYIYNIAQDLKYYTSGTTTTYSTSISYLRTRLSVLIGDKVCVICNARTNSSSYSTSYDIGFAWDGTTVKQLTINSAKTLPTNIYNSTAYHYERGINLVTDNTTTYTESYKIYQYSSSTSTIALKTTTLVPEASSSGTSQIYPCGFYDDYIVFGYLTTSSPNTLILSPINNTSYYEIVPFRESYEISTAFYNRLIFTKQNDGNYMFMPVFNYINGYTGQGVVLKNLDE